MIQVVVGAVVGVAYVVPGVLAGLALKPAGEVVEGVGRAVAR